MSASEWRTIERGLSRHEAARRLAEVGPNALPEAVRPGLWQRWLRQFESPLIYILLFALLLDLGLWVGEGAERLPLESIAIGLILILNAGLGVYQEGKAEAALARLKALSLPFVWAVRDGTLVHVPVKNLVPGDVVRIEAGDRVQADGTLAVGQGVTLDESILTGESLPIDKDLGAELFSGTLLVKGKGYMEVTGTGPRSSMGRLATVIGTIEAGKTPLERRLGEFANQVALAILALGLVLTLGGVLVEGIGRLGQVFLFSVALAVAAVPEGLPAVLTLTLAMGVERLAGRKAIVRRLSAVESLGSVTVIATDKTGTLTENRMNVRALDAVDQTRALHAMVLANDAETGSRIGDPLETALLDYAGSQGVDAHRLIRDRPRISGRPFDSTCKFMRVTVEEDGRRVSYLKGAPEVLIARSRLDEVQKRDWEAKVMSHAAEGHRVVALAWGWGESEEAVVFLGLVLLWDPPRREVPDAIRRATAAGIRVIMITGDHAMTAKAVGGVIGITTERVLTGHDIDRLSPQELSAAAGVVNVFARVSPEHKLRLVETLKDMGEIVAVTGDGVNDAPALKRSDVGIAMGQRGSDVSREVADVVLMDDNFATIVAAIEEGRNIYENIQKFIRFFFSTDLALILLMTAGLGLAFALGIKDPAGGTFLLPLTAVQLLWINFVADGPPALAMALDRNPGVMDRPPRAPSAKLLDAASLRFVAISAAAKASVGVAVIAALPWFGSSLGETRTSLFLYESVLQLMFAYPARRIGSPALRNIWVHLAVWVGIALQALTLAIAPLQAVLGLVPISWPIFATIMLAALSTWGLAELPCRWAADLARAPPKRPDEVPGETGLS
jgi:Ca2+-transporting ATPase